MSRILPHRFDSDYLDRSPRSDVLLREEPDEEDEDENEQEEGKGKVPDDEGHNEEDRGGYSVRVYRLCRW